MRDIHSMLLYYIILINIASILLYGWDKYCAIHHRWRISEVSLLCIAVLGGSMGAFLGMKIFRHKTLHWKFRLGIPLIFLIHMICLIYIDV